MYLYFQVYVVWGLCIYGPTYITDIYDISLYISYLYIYKIYLATLTIYESLIYSDYTNIFGLALLIGFSLVTISFSVRVSLATLIQSYIVLGLALLSKVGLCSLFIRLALLIV